MKIAIFTLIFSLLSFCLYAQNLTVAEMFNEGMVLQQKSAVNIWGTDTPGSLVKIRIHDKEFSTKTAADGSWMLTASKLTAGGPYTMTITNNNDTIQFNEVYVGEVWIAGGQSNMGWTLEKSENGSEHIKAAQNKNIRFVLVPNVNYEGQRTKGDMNWRTATSENVAPMSGVAYFFAEKLQKELNVPVGIVCCYKGGTAAEVWMDREVLLNNPDHAPIVESYEDYLLKTGSDKYETLYSQYEKEMKVYRDSVKRGFKDAVRPVEPMGPRHYKRPYGLYNTMLKRIIPYTAKGVIWYQGEANAPRSEQYRTLFPALIKEWRADFKQPEMPFLFVQLANYDHPKYSYSAWAELREAQLMTWQNVKNTGMVVTMDVGEKNDIHPVYKEPVGNRLADCALNTVYHKNIPYSGPIYKKAKFNKDKVELSFNFIYGGLRSDGELKGFTICGKDGLFIPAKASIQKNKVIVWSDTISNPQAVRYNWANWGEGNLTNTTGLPASPFRTDNFPLHTAGVKNSKY